MYVCNIYFFQSHSDMCHFFSEFFTPVITDCTAGVTVEFSEALSSSECYNIFKPLNLTNYHSKTWSPQTENDVNTLILTFHERTQVSSLRMIDLYFDREDRPTLDVVTFVKFTKDNTKQRVSMG